MARKLTVAQLLKSKVINRQESLILGELRRNGKKSNRELSVALCLPINVITPRTYSLRAKGYVVPAGVKYDTVTNRTVRTWQS